MRRIAVLLATLAVWPIAAQADELSDMKAGSMGSIHALQERVKVLEQEKHDKAATGSVGVRRTKPPVVIVRPAVPPLLVTAAPVVAPDLKPVGPVPEAEKARLEIHGSIQLDAIYDFKKTNPNWEGTLRPSQIPVECPPVGFDPGCGKNGVTNFNIRASSLDIRVFLPTDAGEVKTRLAFDLWGGADQNQVRFRLTQAWASFGQFGADKTYFVLNGTSTSNKVVTNAVLRRGDLVLFDRNNHKSLHQGALARPAQSRSSCRRRAMPSA
jgi:hypothetical protein